MNSMPIRRAVPTALSIGTLEVGMAIGATPAPVLTLADDGAGQIGTYDASGPIDRSNPFFQSLGSNGRSCSTCHIASQAMSFTPAHARHLYQKTDGADPLFASVDGANCPSVARTDIAGHSLLLQNGSSASRCPFRLRPSTRSPSCTILMAVRSSWIPSLLPS
jgi:hypothetical protein